MMGPPRTDSPGATRQGGSISTHQNLSRPSIGMMNAAAAPAAPASMSDSEYTSVAGNLPQQARPACIYIYISALGNLTAVLQCLSSWMVYLISYHSMASMYLLHIFTVQSRVKSGFCRGSYCCVACRPPPLGRLLPFLFGLGGIYRSSRLRGPLLRSIEQ